MGRRLAVAAVLAATLLTAAPSARAAGHRRSPPTPSLPTLTAKQLFRRLDAAKKAHRPVVVHFWATWCPPCVKELPRFLRAMPRWTHRAEVLVLAVVSPKEALLARKMAGAGPGRFRLVAKDPSTIAARFDEKWNGGLPATFVVDRRGRIAYRVIGPFDPKAVAKALGIP